MGVKNDKDIASLFLALKHILQIIKNTKALFIFLHFFHVFSFFLHLKHGVYPLVRPHFEFTKKKNLVLYKRISDHGDTSFVRDSL